MDGWLISGIKEYVSDLRGTVRACIWGNISYLITMHGMYYIRPGSIPNTPSKELL